MANSNNGMVRGRLANLGFEEPKLRKGGNVSLLQQTALIETSSGEGLPLRDKAQERGILGLQKKRKKKNNGEAGSPIVKE